MKRVICCVCLLLCFTLPQIVAAQVYKIYIDPGHYRNNGARFENEKEVVTEEEITLAVALKLRDLLENDTFTGVDWDVRMSRETLDSNIVDLRDRERVMLDDLVDRAEDANIFRADLFLSIHCNSSEVKDVGDGTETFWCDEGGKPVESQKFARIVQRHMSAHGDWNNRRVVEDNTYLPHHLAVLSTLMVPGCLSEIGFLNTVSNRRKLVSPYWQYRFAEAYRDAIFEYLDLPLPRYLSITLESGENMISIPGIPANPDSGSLIGKKAIATPIVRRSDPADRVKRFVTALQFGKSYWVYSFYQDDLLVSYFPKDEYTIRLEEGITMIGSVSGLASFLDTVRMVNRGGERINEKLWIWDAAQQRFDVARSSVIEPGVGYSIQVYEDVTITVSSVFEIAAPPVQQVPEETRLLANFPNPFNPETWIPFELERAGDVTISIYTISGHLVREISLGHIREGFYSTKETAAHWDGRNEQGTKVASGVYFYMLQVDGISYTKKMLLLK